jgi:hypothetical protein
VVRVLAGPRYAVPALGLHPAGRVDLGRLLLHHAESVPVWVDEDDEVGIIGRLVRVASGAESDESFHLGLLILGVEVEVDRA